jgi:cytochrome b
VKDALSCHDNLAAARSVLVWDLPVRLFHWPMVAGFACAWLTAESERWRLVRVTLRCTMAGPVAFRLLWGLVGTRHALLADFVRGPRKVWAHLQSLLHGRPEHQAGHNTAGALAIAALLALTPATAGFGWAQYHALGGEWLEQAHKTAASLMMAVVLVHLAGVLLGSLAHREHLVRAMITGRKHADPSEGVARAWRALGAMMRAAVLGFWWLQWRDAPAAQPSAATLTTDAPQAQGSAAGPGRQRRRHDDDD